MLTASTKQVDVPQHNDQAPDPVVKNSEDPRRIYLRLLPPAQIIEICLTFEPHVPLQVKHTVWPIDIHAAISSLDGSQQIAESSTNHPPEESNTSLPAGSTLSQQVRPSGTLNEPSISLKNILDAVQHPQTSLTTNVVTDGSPKLANAPTDDSPTSSSTQPPAGVNSPPTSTPALATSEGQSANATQPSTPTLPQNSQLSTSAPQPQAPQAQASASRPPDAAHPYPPYIQQPPYPYPAYGYHGQPPYAQAPFYGPPPGYLAPYPGYPYPGQPGYPPPPAPHHAQLYPPPRSTHPAHPHSASPPAAPPSGEDLPSYEDMLVEALVDLADPEGSAPKDVFLWMEARYPLQTNFRPSASQALQKAYRRGRFEKRPNGKYLLNPAWEGGATSKRTTRRPQTLAQTVYAQTLSSQPPSLFTHAPLAQRPSATSPPPSSTASPATPTTTTPMAAYPGYYGHPNAHNYNYPTPAYGAPPSQLQPPSAPPATAAAPPATAAASGKSPANGTVAATPTAAPEKDGPQPENLDAAGDISDAWEAAQHILRAINFGILQGPSGASGSTRHPPPVSADAGVDFSALAGSNPVSEPVRGTLTSEERASLQAQLALLAAQLSEIAGLDEDEENMNGIAIIPLPAPQLATAPATPNALIDVNHLPDLPTAVLDPILSATGGEQPRDDTSSVGSGNRNGGEAVGGEDDSDEDMEMVEVPTMSMMDALRT